MIHCCSTMLIGLECSAILQAEWPDSVVLNRELLCSLKELLRDKFFYKEIGQEKFGCWKKKFCCAIYIDPRVFSMGLYINPQKIYGMRIRHFRLPKMLISEKYRSSRLIWNAYTPTLIKRFEISIYKKEKAYPEISGLGRK